MIKQQPNHGVINDRPIRRCSVDCSASTWSETDESDTTSGKAARREFSTISRFTGFASNFYGKLRSDPNRETPTYKTLIEAVTKDDMLWNLFRESLVDANIVTNSAVREALGIFVNENRENIIVAAEEIAEKEERERREEEERSCTGKGIAGVVSWAKELFKHDRASGRESDASLKSANADWSHKSTNADWYFEKANAEWYRKNTITECHEQPKRPSLDLVSPEPVSKCVASPGDLITSWSLSNGSFLDSSAMLGLSNGLITGWNESINVKNPSIVKVLEAAVNVSDLGIINQSIDLSENYLWNTRGSPHDCGNLIATWNKSEHDDETDTKRDAGAVISSDQNKMNPRQPFKGVVQSLQSATPLDTLKHFFSQRKAD